MTNRKPFAVVAIIDHVPVATFVEIAGIYVGSYGGDDALQNANALADGLNAAFETAVAERVKEAVREAVKPLTAELRRLMDIVSEEDYGLLSDVLAETEPEGK